MRLIDANAFIKMMEEKCDTESAFDLLVLSVCRGGVKIMPTIDAVQVRHGRWIPCHPLGDNAPDGYMCSACHVGGWDETDFCPNCGAKMDWKENGNETD